MIILNEALYCNKDFKMQISLKIKKGERLSIFGYNGAGKSTLIKIIAGFLYIKSGEVLINNINYTKKKSFDRPISIIFQENNFFDHLNVIENICIGSKFLSHKKDKKISNIINSFNIKDIIYKLPDQISIGQRQLIPIARCFLRKKPILLMDEPFSALDFISKFNIMNLINKFCIENKITLIMVSHNFEDAKKITERSIIIKKGKIYWDGCTHKMIKENKEVFNKNI